MKLSRQAWMEWPETRAVMAALGAGQARFVGGAVRNALMGLPVSEIDIATTLLPEHTVAKLRDAGLRAIPTGMAHGTVTALAGERTYEITTLRRDVETDGRHAVVAFSDDWAEDAKRRDFTVNALYADETGDIVDMVGGIGDIAAGLVRFVGDPATRIAEDHLRILRLFRFHAWYGKGEIDSASLKAAAAAKTTLTTLSGERVQKEMLRLLEAEDPAPVLRVMMAAGILPIVLPGVQTLDRLARLAKIDADSFFDPDPLLRLAALLPSDIAAVQALRQTMKLSNAQSTRLEDLAGGREKIVSYLSIREVRKLLYRLGSARFRDRVFLHWAADPKDSNGVQWRALLSLADAWQRPDFPLSGETVLMAGVPQGPLVGRILSEVEDWWIDSDFLDDEFSLAERLKAVVQAMAY